MFPINDLDMLYLSQPFITNLFFIYIGLSIP